MAAKKQTLSTSILNAVLNNVSYVNANQFASLYTSAPTATADGTEVSTGGGTLYARVNATGFFSAASAGSSANQSAITFPVAGASWGTVTHAAVCVAGTAGVFDILYFGALGTPKVVGVGDQLNFAIGALVVTES
jgi:hypothetical protein